MTTNSAELKPCPFCGADAVAATCPVNGIYHAGCADADCIGHMAAYDFTSEETAITAWNHRSAAQGEQSKAATGYCADCNSWGGEHKDGCQRRPERFFKPASQAGSAEQVSEIQRYSAFCSLDGGGPAEIEEDPLGDLVLFSDHLKVLAALSAPERKVMTNDDAFAAADRAIKKTYPGEAPNRWGAQPIPNYGILRAAIAAELLNQQGEQTAPGWQPIETAPKDGTPILLGRAESEFHTAESTVGWWQEAVEDGVDYMGGDAGFVDFAFQVFNPGRSFGNPKYMHAADQPTHWMPLPAAPSTAQKDGGRE